MGGNCLVRASFKACDSPVSSVDSRVEKEGFLRYIFCFKDSSKGSTISYYF